MPEDCFCATGKKKKKKVLMAFMSALAFRYVLQE